MNSFHWAMINARRSFEQVRRVTAHWWKLSQLDTSVEERRRLFEALHSSRERPKRRLVLGVY